MSTHVSGTGVFKTVNMGAPSAGSNFSGNVPLGKTWRLLGVSFALTTGAAVAARVSWVVLSQVAGVTTTSMCAAIAQPANTSYLYRALAIGGFVPYVPPDGCAAIALPADGVVLPAAGSIQVTIVNKQAADSLSAVVVYVEEFDEAAAVGSSYPVGGAPPANGWPLA